MPARWVVTMPAIASMVSSISCLVGAGFFSATRSRVNSALAAVNRAWAFAQPRQIFQSGIVLIEFAVGQAIDHMLIGKGGDPLSGEPEMRGKLCCGDAGSRSCPSPERQGNQSCSGVMVSTLPAGGSLIGKKP